jgi:putative transposase
MQAAKVKKKRHSRVQIATKLAEANDLATQGKLQSEIARTLGVSVMTLHRWRKALLGVQAAVVAPHDTGQPDGTRGADDRIAELTDLLLGKIKLEEAAQSQTIRRVKGRDGYSDNDQV